MGFFDRLSRLVRANANAALNMAEDPVKILDQSVADMQADLVKLRQAVATAIASQKRIQNQAEQAEAQAEAMKEAFVHNVDALVTRDYLDARFTEFETRLEAKIDRRLAGLDNRFAGIDIRLERMEGRFNLVYWMQGLTIVCVVIPVIRGYLG